MLFPTFLDEIGTKRLISRSTMTSSSWSSVLQRPHHLDLAFYKDLIIIILRSTTTSVLQRPQFCKDPIVMIFWSTMTSVLQLKTSSHTDELSSTKTPLLQRPAHTQTSSGKAARGVPCRLWERGSLRGNLHSQVDSFNQFTLASASDKKIEN